MAGRVRLGLLTPSSNTVLEPRAAAVLAGLEDVSAHFGRFRVIEISLEKEALDQFTFEPQLQAAELLADARVDVIAWAGTSGGWVGVENDRALSRKITERTGVPATTSTIATLAALDAFGAKTYALVTPYLRDVQEAIQKNFRAEGYSCVAERHLEDKGNFSFSEYDEETIARMMRDVASASPRAIAVYCTNFDGTRVAPLVEAELGIPVIDSISCTIWHAMRLAGCDPARVAGWGRLFSIGRSGETAPADPSVPRQATNSAASGK
ncbi:Asp/Glu/hydantoin racemase [Rhizobiales bacterium]|uniref:maleate cis-trans isomerase family protein n=1 Tax=Hongsoonwoonella zoysiae TaxID=2821844 RepID=UPI00156148F6|nr:aspartate/glutamate racemase family protein [Hongsoonwoonella zoysiae]NRG17928.1 Asp/Glu/hydantoin racemase [Hongsoonwoonella zoysiae]